MVEKACWVDVYSTNCTRLLVGFVEHPQADPGVFDAVLDLSISSYKMSIVKDPSPKKTLKENEPGGGWGQTGGGNEVQTYPEYAR